MMNRIAMVMLTLSFGCGSGAGHSQSASKPVAAPASEPEQPAATPASPSNSSPAPIAKAMTYEEAKKHSDELWKKAEAQKTNVEAWEQAAAALAGTAKLAAGGGGDAQGVLRGALAAWRNADQLKTANSSESKSNGGARRSLPEREVLRISVLEQLASLLAPDDKELAMVEYRRGRILWNFGHYDEAIGPFVSVVERFPASQEAKYAASQALDSLVRVKNYAGLEKQAAKMLANRVLVSSHAELKTTLERIRHQVGAKDAQAMAEASQFEACAQAYLNLLKRDGKQPEVRGDHLLYNASVCFEKGGQPKRAIQILRKLARTFPSSELADKAKERADALAAQ